MVSIGAGISSVGLSRAGGLRGGPSASGLRLRRVSPCGAEGGWRGSRSWTARPPAAPLCVDGCLLGSIPTGFSPEVIPLM